MIAVSSVVNLSHPPAMPSLGKAAPDVVKKVENISLEDVMNLNWKGGSENVKKQAEKPKPVPVAVANRQPTLPGEKGFSKSAGRGRGVLAASNSTAPGKPLGAMEQIKLLEQKALAEQQQQQQQQQQQHETSTSDEEERHHRIFERLVEEDAAAETGRRGGRKSYDEAEETGSIAVVFFSRYRSKVSATNTTGCCCCCCCCAVLFGGLRSKAHAAIDISSSTFKRRRQHFVASARSQTVTIFRCARFSNAAAAKVNASAAQTSTRTKAKENRLGSGGIRPTCQRHVRQTIAFQTTKTAAGR